jgi:uncharacterized protein involved in exopolysaccharide biosynthesis
MKTPEIRRQQRIKIIWPIDIRTADGGNGQTLYTKDICSRGMCLQGAPLKTSENDDTLRICIPQLHPLKEIEAVLRWKNENHLSGWEFTYIEPDTQRLLQERIGDLQENPQEVRQDPGRWEKEVELWDYFVVLVKWRWLISIALCLAALGALIFSSLKSVRVTFTAQAYILPLDTTYRLGPADDGSPGPVIPHLAILGSIPLGKRVLWRESTFMSEKGEVQQSLISYMGMDKNREMQALEALRGMATFSPSSGGIIQISASAPDSQLALQITNAYADELIAYDLDYKTTANREYLDFVTKRRDELKDSLAYAERQLDTFKSDNRSLLELLSTTELSRLEREVALKRSLFLSVANQRELLDLKVNNEISNLKVLNYAESALRQSDGRRLFRPAIIGALAGALIAAFLAFFLEFIKKNRETGALDPIRRAWREDRERFRRIFRSRT